jgi:hypothetical protein
MFLLLAPPVDALARFPVDFSGGLARFDVHFVGGAMMGFGRARGCLSEHVENRRLWRHCRLSRSNQLPTIDISEPVVFLFFTPLSLPS